MQDRDNLFAGLADAARWEPGCTFSRKNPLPLDEYSVFATLSDAEDYVATNPVAYPGQVLAIVNDTQSDVYVVEPNGSLTKLAAGGDTSDLLTKLNQEAADRIAADNYISSQVSSLPGDLAAAKTDLAVTVEKLETAEDGFLKSYTIKQGGKQVGDTISIPRDFLVKSAAVKTCASADAPEAGYAVGDKYLDFVINAKDGTAADEHLYVKLTDLVDVYTGVDGAEIEVSIDGSNAVSAGVKDGAITAAKLAAGVSAEISAATSGVAANAAAIASQKTSLEAYADQAEADAVAAAKADAAGKIAALTASFEPGKSADGQQKFVTKITQDGGVVAGEAAVIQASDVNGLTAMVDQAEANAKTYTDTKVNALDVADVAVGKQFVTAVSQTDGKIEVSRGGIALSDLSGDVAADIKTAVAGAYDEAGAAAAAQTAAEKTAADALAATKAELTGLVSTTSATTLADAKAYADGVVAPIKTDVETVSADLDAAEAKIEATEADVATLSGDIASVSAFAKTDLSNAIADEASRAKAIEAATDAAVKNLSADYASTSATHAASIAGLRTDVDAISGDVGDIQGKIELLENAMHFRGVIGAADVGTSSVVEALAAKYADAIDGDVVVYLEDGTEYVFASGSWHELGNENNHATKAQLEVETDARTAADAALSAAIDSKVVVDGISASTLNIVKISRDDYHQLVLDGTVDDGTVYIVSADNMDMYGEKITNLLSGTDSTDAATVGQVNAAKAELQTAIANAQISAATFNGVEATIEDNAIAFDISCIVCGGADA